MKLKRTAAAVTALLLAAAALPSVHASAEPSVSAKAAVVLNGLTLEVLYEKNADTRLPMASTTKIMTSLLLIESGGLDDTVTVSPKAASTEGSSIGLRAEDRITKHALLLGMLLESGNDAAVAAAEAVSGSTEDFARLMNSRATELGMKNSHFVTPSGLDAEGHYSTAYDMALLTAEAIQSKLFRESIATVKTEVTYGTPLRTAVFRNHNRLLTEYSGMLGGKTGYTSKSGRCLVTVARRDAKLIIAVTLNDPDDWSDHKKLLDYGFERTACCDITFRPENSALEVVGGELRLVKLAVPTRLAGINAQGKKYITSAVELLPFAYAPVKAGEIVGSVKYYYKGILIADDSIYIGGDIAAAEKQYSAYESFVRNLRLLLYLYK